MLILGFYVQGPTAKESMLASNGNDSGWAVDLRHPVFSVGSIKAGHKHDVHCFLICGFSGRPANDRRDP